MSAVLAVIRDSNVDISVWGIFIGALLGAAVFLFLEWLLGMLGLGARARPIAAILGALVFIAYAF